jgi:hypothetical protein
VMVLVDSTGVSSIVLSIETVKTLIFTVFSTGWSSSIDENGTDLFSLVVNMTGGLVPVANIWAFSNIRVRINIPHSTWFTYRHDADITIFR